MNARLSSFTVKTLVIARQTLLAVALRPTAWVMTVLFLLVAGGLFWLGFFSAAGAELSLRAFFERAPLLLAFFVPSLTMATLSEERRRRTLELQRTLPISMGELALGTFLGTWAATLAALGATLAYPVLLARIGPLDWGPIWGGYAGVAALAAAYVAIGLAVASATRDMVVANLGAFSLCFLLTAAGDVAPVLGGAAQELLEGVSTSGRLARASRGVLDARDGLFFASLCAAALLVATTGLERGWRRVPSATLSVRLAVGLATLVAINALASPLRARVDLTHDARHTLAPATRALLADAPGDVRFYLVLSETLPTHFGGFDARLEDLLRDLRAARPRRVDWRRLDPAASDEERARAEALGVSPVVVPDRADDAFTLRQVYASLVVAVQSDDGEDALQVIGPLTPDQNLEYEIGRALHTLIADPEPARVGFPLGADSVIDRYIEEVAAAAPADEADPRAWASALLLGAINAQVFDDRFTLEALELAELGAGGVPEGVDALVFVGPNATFAPEAAAAIGEFVEAGGGLAYFANPWRVAEPGALEENVTGLEGLLEGWGIVVQRDALLDREVMQLSVRWPILPGEDGAPREVATVEPDPRLPLMTTLDAGSPLVAGVAALAMPPLNRRRPLPIGSLALTDEAIARGEAAGEAEPPVRVVAATSPSAVRRTSLEGLSRSGAEAARAEEVSGTFATVISVAGLGGGGGRLVVASSAGVVANLLVQSDPLRDPANWPVAEPAAASALQRQIAQYGEDSIAFFENVGDWLTAGDEFVRIRARRATPVVRGTQLSRAERLRFQATAVGGVPLVVCLLGGWVALLRRRSRRRLAERFGGAE